MCGIFGLIVYNNANCSEKIIERSLKTLALLSERRGRDSSGFAFRNEGDKTINVIRASMPISSLIKSIKFKREINIRLEEARSSKNGSRKNIFAVIGHSRLVTNGSQLNDENNQPVVKSGVVGVHNGIIVNVDELWDEMPIGPREYDIDTEVMFSLFRHFDKTCNSSIASISKAIKGIIGTVATGFFLDNKDELVLATNNGSLYVMSDLNNILIFASEKYILKKIKKIYGANRMIFNCKINQVKPNTGYLVSLTNFNLKKFRLDENSNDNGDASYTQRFGIDIATVKNSLNNKSLLVDFNSIVTNPKAIQEKKLLQYNIDAISKLRKCTKCLLPETFPFIRYNSNGVCNYCNNYKLKNQGKPLKHLMRLIEKYRRQDGDYDCIVPYSGGRDSTFTLHMVKKELGLNPIAFTYDWGMVTDLARRNIARVCGKLGVENIIVAADIVKKRNNIKKNIKAWLKKPSLGMIPLFMSGDKYFFYYTNKLKKQTGVSLNIWGINKLENTDFKTGFAGVKPFFDKKQIYSLSASGMIKFITYVAKNFLANPYYFNSSNLDSFGSILSRYMFPKKDYYSFFDYYQWNEDEIEKLIIEEYNWEKAIDTKSSWRIGDGTASFYNYIYYTIAGFSENDTFRSNQVREGIISREDAYKLAQEENRPRYENIKWYLEIVGLDFEKTIKKINQIPKLYELH